jgi:hypothetical protein
MRLLLVGVRVERSWEGMVAKDIMLSMFAAKVKSHLMLSIEAYEAIYVVM